MNTVDDCRYLEPVLKGESWRIGAPIDLGAMDPDRRAEYVDHHVYRDAEGVWHLWACVRRTAVGRVLCHWRSDDLYASDWAATGEVIRASTEHGESISDWYGEEWLQSPFVVEHEGGFYMLYGGHGSGADAGGHPRDGDDPAMDCQICLMLSPDGRRWRRYVGDRGYSRLFLGPGEARDPCVLRIADRFVIYYAGYRNSDRNLPAFFARTSYDLLNWSDPRIVHGDLSPRFGDGPNGCESPHVVVVGGAYYLFRTQDYARGLTHVFRSEDPFDFGCEDASLHYVTTIDVAAPEVIITPDGGEMLISSSKDLCGGIRLQRLSWRE